MPTVRTKTQPKNLPDNYWYLTISVSRPDLTAWLDAKGVSYAKSATMQDLQAIHVRHQRGFLDYAKCSLDELHRFCADRRLSPLPEPASRSSSRRFKQLLVNHLETADEDVTFDRFKDLPEEIRLDIYDLYFWDLEATTNEHIWDQGTHGPCYHPNNSVRTQPPITTASRLARSESLKPFYEICSFRFNVPQLGRGFVEVSTGRFLLRAPQSVLDRVQNIILAGEVCTDYEIPLLWAVAVSKGTGKQDIEEISLPRISTVRTQNVMHQRKIALQWPYESGTLENGEAVALCIRHELRYRLPLPPGPDEVVPRKFRLCREYHDAMPLFFSWIHREQEEEDGEDREDGEDGEENEN